MNRVRKIIYSNRFYFWLFNKARSLKSIFASSLELENHGCGTMRKEVSGKGHKCVVGDGTVLRDTVIHMRGVNNYIQIGRNCHFGPDCSLWTEGENVSIIIGDNVTFTRKVQLNAQEKEMCIKIGNDCMFSNRIVVRTSDSHPIYSSLTGERINLPSSVIIGEHVWVAPNSKIMKGVHIENGAIIGSDTMVTKDIPANVLAVGHPAKVVKTDIFWSREDVIFSENGV